MTHLVFTPTTCHGQWYAVTATKIDQNLQTSELFSRANLWCFPKSLVCANAPSAFGPLTPILTVIACVGVSVFPLVSPLVPFLRFDSRRWARGDVLLLTQGNIQIFERTNVV